MSQSEHRLADTSGRFLKFVDGGTEVDDPKWSNGRLLLSNRRLILVGKGGKRTIPLATIDALTGRVEVNGSVAGISNFTSLRMGEDVLLITTKEHRAFELDLCTALLDEEQVLVRHPAVEGGVVHEPEWEGARVNLGDGETVNVATNEGSFVTVELDDVGKVEVAERTVKGETREVVEIEHSDGGTSVETHLAGTSRTCSFMKVVFERGLELNSGPVELDRNQKQVLMALYSGISPFEIPEFTGIDVEATEETYERLVELDVLSEVRIRREVELTPRGRNLASRAMSDE